jgi:di/tricarboxylate transporter
MLTWWAVACFTAALAVAFEVWIPNVDTRFTADPIDVLAYFTGAGIWRFVEPLGR